MKISSSTAWICAGVVILSVLTVSGIVCTINQHAYARHQQALTPTIIQSGYVRTLWKAPGRYGYNDPDTVIGFETDAGNVSTIRFEGIQGALWQGLHATIQYKLVIDSDDGSEVDFTGQKVYSLLSAQQLK